MGAVAKIMQYIICILAICNVGFGMQDIYISQSGTGAGTSCQDSRSVAWFNSKSSWGTSDEQISSGKTIHLCGLITTSLIFQGSGNPGQYITLTFEPGSKMSSPRWDDVMWGRRAAILIAQKQYIKIDGKGAVVETTQQGTNLQYKEGAYGLWAYDCHNCEFANLVLTGMYIREPKSGESIGAGVGIKAQGNNVSIHGFTISEANTGIAYDYPGGRLTKNVRIYNNTISRVSNGITFGSGNTNAQAENVEIFDNDLSDGYVWDGIFTGCTGDCWFHNDGIQVWAVHDGSELRDLKIHSNYIHGDWGTHITGWIFVEGNVIYPEIYNNVLVSAGTSYPSNGFITAQGKIHHNTISGNERGGNGILTRGPHPTEIRNNLFHNIGTAIAIGDGSNKNSDYNLFHFKDRFLMATIGSGGAFLFSTSIDAWRQKTGNDMNSIVADAMISSDFRPAKGSPAIDTGILSYRIDKDKKQRPQGASSDIGAYEYNALCTPNWLCSEWGNCHNYEQKRTCNDSNNCGITAGKPAEKRVCGVNITEAERGTIAYPFQIVNDNTTSGGRHIETAREAGSASYAFSIQSRGRYRIIGMVYARDSGSDSVYFSIDNTSYDIWDLNPKDVPEDYNTWRHDEVSKRGLGDASNPQSDPYIIILEGGNHTLSFKGREPSVLIDYFFVIPVTLCTSSADADCDGCVTQEEVLFFISKWKSGGETLKSLMEAISLWKSSC